MCLDTSPYATVCCGRRAGKSEGIARWALAMEGAKERAPVLLFAPTRATVKRIFWKPLCDIIRALDLPLAPRESTLTFRRGGYDRIYLTGCDNQTEIGKMRGGPGGWGAVAGDEAQLFPGYLEQLVDESLVPALMDSDGLLRLSGSPGPVPIGYFHSVIQSPEWSHHAWTPWENPHVNAQKLLDRELKRRGITSDHPSIQREFFGRWAHDAAALVFSWSEANHYEALPLLTDFVLGVDLGFDDADAIAVLGWSKHAPELYLVAEHVLAKQTITQLTDKLRHMVELYRPLATVIDTGGLGKKIAEEIQRRTGIPLQAADKVRKLEHIELLNDALRTSRVRAKRGSRFAQDALRVEWDRSNPEAPKISDRLHSDICDAVLYAYVRALHWLHEPAPAPLDQADEQEQIDEEYELEAARERGEMDEPVGW